jgi:AcrR family transcriptional regulator
VNQYIEIRHAEWLTLYEVRVAKADSARERILAVFDAYQDHAEFAYEHGFRGCGLLNAAAELSAEDAGRQAVRAHKEEVERIIYAHLRELLPEDAHRAATLAAQISFLLEGAMARAGLEGNSARIITARGMASTMLVVL